MSKLLACCVIVFGAAVARAGYHMFDDLPLAPESYWDGSDGSGGFSTKGVYFPNNYDAESGTWDGFAYSNITDDASSGGAGSEYVACSRYRGALYSDAYGIAHVSTEAATLPRVDFGWSCIPLWMCVTNTEYDHHRMAEGTESCRKYGGSSGHVEDWLLLAIHGLDHNGQRVGAPVEVYLADFRFADDERDYIVDEWVGADGSGIPEWWRWGISGLEFELTSSDIGASSGLGPHTPTYFAIDQIAFFPEPTTISLLALGCLAAIGRRRR